MQRIFVAFEQQQVERFQDFVYAGDLNILVRIHVFEIVDLRRAALIRRVQLCTRQLRKDPQASIQQVDGPLVQPRPAKLQGFLRLCNQFGEGDALVNRQYMLWPNAYAEYCRLLD